MNFVFHNIWLSGIAFAIFGTGIIFIGGHGLVLFASWLRFRSLIQSGRTIKWQDVIEHCQSGPVTVVRELRSHPQMIWFLKSSDASTFFSKDRHQHTKGLLVLDPPDINQMSAEIERAGGKFVEVDLNATLL
jgi:hypothetical protein